ncbi:THAP domain-containing 9, partial, partial [Paramuricea clavata]
TTTSRPLPKKREASPPPPEDQIPAKKKRKSSVNSDHGSYIKSPTTVMKKLKKTLKKKNNKIRSLSAKNLRKEKTIKGLVKKLEEIKALSEEQSQHLMSNFGHMTKDIFTNEQKNEGNSTGSRYSEQIKQFAISLHFYSAKAYKFVRKSLHLPHPSTIRSWASSIECEPGFLSNVIEHLQNTLEDDNKDCIILVDEMSIKKEVLWDAKKQKFAGNTDYGPILAEDQDTIAHNALVVMAVGLQKPWSYPIAYFLVNHMDSKMQAQIIKESINLLTDAGLDVHAVTFDGCSKNLATARRLGCKIDSFDGSFQHPTRPGKTLYVILDICHMLKLARNALGDKEIFYTSGGETISWYYIKELFNVQQSDILHLGNKLKNVHIKWHNQKMKVAVAAQTLSSSVAAGMIYLRNLNVKQFEKCEQTAEFIQNINDIFDILNTKSKFGKRFKSPLTLENYAELRAHLLDIISYLKKLKDVDGTKLVDGPRKTFILGFAVSANSILAIAKNLLSREHNNFKYVLTYRFSQDQIEMFFSKIRGRFGWNNNPNALQFKWALRALLQKNQIAASEKANCAVIEEEKMDEEMHHVDHNIIMSLTCSTIWRDDVLAYIAGYIVKKITVCIKCPECAIALVAIDKSQAEVPVPDDHSYRSNSKPESQSLITIKSYGKLITLSPSVVKVVKATDRNLRQLVGDWTSVTKTADVKASCFQNLQQHSRESHLLDEQFRDDHITIIIKKIVDLYINIFVHRFGKVYSDRVVREGNSSRRPKLNKLILFGND